MSDSFGNFQLNNIESLDKFDILEFVEGALNNSETATFNLPEDNSDQSSNIFQNSNTFLLPSETTSKITSEMTVTFHQNIFTQGSTNPTVNSNSQNNTNNQFIKPFTVNIKEEKQLSNSAQTPFLDFIKWEDDDPDSNIETSFTSAFLQQQVAQRPLVYLPIVVEIEKMCTAQSTHLEEIRGLQRTFFQNPQNETFQKLLEQQKNLKESLSQEHHALQQLKESLILTPHDLHKVTQLMDTIAIQNTQLELYFKELQAFIQFRIPQPFAALVIQKQPFPNVFMKRKQLAEQEMAVVKILKGVCVDIQQASPCKVGVICHSSYTPKTKEPKPILNNDSAPFDTSEHSCKWQFTFQTGTRKDIAMVQFAVQVQCGNQQIMTLKSEMSRPFLVITNECQYGESLQVLFLKDVFSNRSEVPWNLFANEVTRYFLLATRQDLARPVRSLSALDLRYLHFCWFGGQQVIDKKSAEKFWDWFAKVLQKLRYQRHLCTLWKLGLIYGFINKNLMEQILLQQQVGSFALRFSETNAGSLSIGYRIPFNPQFFGQTMVKNYLIKQDDISGTKKSIADFIRSRAEFQYILQFCQEYEPNGMPKFKVYPKDVALKQFYSPITETSDTKGYDSLP